jgi:hypothetical protein
MTKKATVTKAGFTRPSTLAGIPLGDHDGLPITQSSGTITGLAGGFSETAALDKIHVPVKARVVALVVLEAESHEYDRVKDGKDVLEEFVENTVYKGESVLLIDPDDVEELIAKHTQRVKEARSVAEAAAKAAKGEFQLPDPVGDAEGQERESEHGGGTGGDPDGSYAGDDSDGA